MNLVVRCTLLTFCCFLAFSCTRDFKANNLQFDSVKWKTRELRARGQMTKDLLSRDYLAGKLNQEVLGILGEPENIDNAGSFEYKTDPGAWLGGANNGPWIHYLHVEYSDGRVVRSYITD
jgi:hypothetical protein